MNAAVPANTEPAAEPERLTTGWEADVPPDDTVLRQAVLAWAEALTVPTQRMGGRVVRTDRFVLTDPGRPASFFTGAVLVAPPAPDQAAWADLLLAVESGLDGHRGWAHLWSAWPTPDLRPRGWELQGHPPVLIRPPGGPLPPATPGIQVRPVTTAAELADWERVCVEGYPLDDLLPWRRGALLDERVLAGGWECWLAYDDTGAAVGAAASQVVLGLTVVIMGVVLPAARRKGCWEALLRARLSRHPELPACGLFSDMSRPGAQKHGFWPVSRLTLWRRAAGDVETGG